MKKILLFIIKAYSFIISPLTGPNCRFYPPCSSYAAQAIEKHGAMKGSWMALCRISRCHPWYKGPFDDPVP